MLYAAISVILVIVWSAYSCCGDVVFSWHQIICSNRVAWASWRLESLAIRLFAQWLTSNKINIKVPHYQTYFESNSAMTSGLPSQRASDVESVLISRYIDVIMTTMAFQITSLTVVYSTVYSDADHRKDQSSASLAFVWGIHRGRWIPRTKGQLRGKCFHLMTSSCMTSP